ncbi:hypothetical protein R3P38DRAFT_2800152 [Favolaschia claudopus]|uniref:Uncharacterized protein n=1 Tax=Favolaschia claudopus TaxID=2862362 RepID=A0AAV9ZYK0_9AGAR
MDASSIFCISAFALFQIVGLASVVAYCAIQCIIGNILGHAIFILAHQDKYFATFHSVVLSSLWRGLVVGGVITFATMLFGLCCLLVTRKKMGDLLFFVVTLTWALEAASLLLAVVANVVGVCILRKRGYGSPLPTLADAAKVASVGAVLAGGTHLWRFVGPRKEKRLNGL